MDLNLMGCESETPIIILDQNSVEQGYYRGPKRTPEEVMKLAEHAKLDFSELIPSTQCLEFAENYASENNLKLVELDDELLDRLCKGETVTIRGDAEEPSVLCTEDKTYEVREAETSNALLIVPGLLIPHEEDDQTIEHREVTNVHYKYFELKQCQPRIGKLLKLLKKKTYDGRPDTDYGYTWKDLLNRVQSSEKELRAGLKKLKAYLIKDLWCELDFDYHFGVLSSILNFIDSNSLPLTAIPKDEVLDNLKELEPLPILEQCLLHFFTLNQEVEGAPLYKIKGEDVSRFCAEVLLMPAGKFNLHEFLNIWQQSVPEGVETHLSHLRGLAIVDRSSSPAVVWHFPSSVIPLDVAQAFAVLFETRAKWTLEDIAPYLEEFTSPQTKVASLLTKYARSSKENGTKYFTARHSK